MCRDNSNTRALSHCGRKRTGRGRKKIGGSGGRKNVKRRRCSEGAEHGEEEGDDDIDKNVVPVAAEAPRAPETQEWILGAATELLHR